jgi:hypothetical protein
MNAVNNAHADLAMATLLRELDVILLLHDAGVLDKKIIAERWRVTASRTDLNITETVRKILTMSAAGLDVTGGPINERIFPS